MDYGIDQTEAPQAGLAAMQPATAPAAPAPAPGLNSVEQYQKDMPPEQKQIESAISFWNDPERIKLAAMAAAEGQRPDLLAWIKRGYEAQQENTIDALGALVAGNTERSLQLFNATGQRKATAIEPGKDAGMHVIKFADGTSREINAEKEFFSFLTPPQQDARQRGQESIAARTEAANARREVDITRIQSGREVADARTAQRAAEFDAKAAEREARIALMHAQAARSDRAGQPKDTDAVDLSEKAQSARVRDITREVNSLREYDAASKTEVGEYDHAARMQIKAVAVAIAARGVRADDAFAQAKAQYDEHKGKVGTTIDEEVKGIRSKGAKSANPLTWANSPDFGEHKNEAGYRTAREKELMGGLRDVAREEAPKTTKQGQSPAGAPRNDATKRPTSSPGATPKAVPDNPAPMATTTKQGQSPTSAAKPRYPDGTRLRKNGQEYVVKNGQPVLVQ